MLCLWASLQAPPSSLCSRTACSLSAFSPPQPFTPRCACRVPTGTRQSKPTYLNININVKAATKQIFKRQSAASFSTSPSFADSIARRCPSLIGPIGHSWRAYWGHRRSRCLPSAHCSRLAPKQLRSCPGRCSRPEGHGAPHLTLKVQTQLSFLKKHKQTKPRNRETA